MNSPSRLALWSLFIITALVLSSTEAHAQLFKKKKKQQEKQIAEAVPTREPLQPGQYEWQPQNAPTGPLLIVVSIDDQVAYVYRNGTEIGRSTVSTGRPGKETPTGVFTILEKRKEHESSIYKGAQMPNMQRLTWTGIAIHAGDLPGYPASAGCIRLPLKFSELLFAETALGATVAITQRSRYPSQSEKPVSILLSTNVDQNSIPIPDRRPFWNPNKSPSGPVSLLLSIGDETLYVYRNGVLIGQAPVGIASGPPIPGGLSIMLDGVVPGENPVVPGRPMRAWSVLTIDSDEAVKEFPINILRSRIRVHPGFARDVYDLMKPGSLMLVTRDKSTSETRSEAGFSVLNPE
ncbi:MAG: L,D-transpeptidase family protein [Verrucomicrobiales bacterium]|nr:L,D-transpeptidase family protein [Verrucomicrobiales bacterium]